MSTASVEVSLEQLYQDYSLRISNYVRKRFPSLRSEEVEDVVQDTFLNAWRTHEQARAETIVSWLHQIAHNLATDVLRKKRVLSKRDADVTFDELARCSDGRDLQEEQAQREPVREAFACLSKEHQRLLALLMAGYTYQQIGILLGKPEGTIKSYMHRARESFKQHYRG